MTHDIRNAWRAAYSATRRTRSTGAETFGHIADALGRPHDNSWVYGTDDGLHALAMQQCLSRSKRDTLACIVLNRFGTLNPFSRSTWTPAARRRSDRALRLRDRMVASGRATCDAGGWVRSVTR